MNEMSDLTNGVFIVQFRVYFFVILGIMFFLMFNCVFLSALSYVLLPSGVINHICMYVCLYVFMYLCMYVCKINRFFLGLCATFPPNIVKIGRLVLRNTANKQTNKRH